MDNVLGEALLAAIGLDRFLSDRQIRITPAVMSEATAISGRARRLLRAAVTADVERGEWPELPEVDALELSERLTRERTPAEEESDIDPDEPEIAAVVAMTAQRVVEYLLSQMPATITLDVFGSRPRRPSDQSIHRLRMAYQVAKDPLAPVRALKAGSLSILQVQALAEMYPALYQALTDELVEAIAVYREGRKTWRLPPAREDQLKTFLRVPSLDPLVADAAQKAYEEPQEAKATGDADLAAMAKQPQTAQRGVDESLG